MRSPRSRRRFRSTALVFTLAAALTPAVPAGATNVLGWQPCERDRTADCATLTLPVTRGGETFPLAVARRRATDPARRIGVLLVNPGGPGASGVSLALGSNRLFGPDVLARFDIIGFDPRGVAGSKPIQCSDEILAQEPRNAPRDQAEFEQLAAYNQRLRADCRRHSGPIADHADTLSVVRDMDALRAALGERRLNYFGASYGTLIGAQYAQHHPDRVRAMVLDGNMDHSLTLPRFLTTAAANGEDSLTEFARWCERDTRCALHGRPVLPRWSELITTADAGRLVESDGVTGVTPDYLINQAYAAFIRVEWTRFAGWLATLRPGTPADPVAAAESRQSLRAHPRPSVFCQDWLPRVANFAEWQRLVTAQRQAAPHLRYSPEAQEAALSCIGWPAKANNPPAPLQLAPGDPILLVNPEHDPATGYSWAVGLHRQAPHRTVLFTYEGQGHTAYPRTDCVRAGVERYLLDQVTPTASCPAAPS
ncbi:alpha/beta hydrolase [Crossiella cryophila]|uniref:Pimeloyl-ACP methyl ester carboxylesterase n=1 Tax=Crossiella cryophila TaxID=43355 RepID=A0A7W7CEZ2_9PSEU|nr:alpha/beta hydrolase [Crossiella cryophila]MBB4679992.1 pimeloyl-ACP methyl ester carboxylesterase [Crossiella cryophila]